MKIHSFIDYISDIIRDKDWHRLPDGLYRGKMGLVLYLAFYSEKMQDEEVREKAGELLANIWEHNPMTLPHDLLNGYIGIAWGIGNLIDAEILTIDEPIIDFIQRINAYRGMKAAEGPGNINWTDRLFSNALFYERVRREEDSLFGYTIDEHIIYLVDESELVLNGRYPYMKVDSRLFHSILHFIKAVDRLQIYPTKTEKLLSVMPQLYDNTQEETWLDKLICHILLSKEFTQPLPALSNLETLRLLSEAGFFTMLYGEPAIFNRVFDLIQKETPTFLEDIPMDLLSEYPLAMDGLCGLGVGLLSYKNEEA